MARLESIEGDPSSPILAFDKSVFYPEGGGQPCDLGTIGGLPLADVTMDGGRILHRLACPLPAGIVAGDELRLVLDQARRKDHSEQHTGQHLVSSTLLRLFGEATKSVHMGSEASTIDFNGPFLDSQGLSEAEDAVNEAIAEDYRICTHLCPPEDLSSFPLRRKPPVAEEIIRVVEIDGIDFTPCCGTHLESTGGLHLIILIKAEKYKGLTRVYFVAGERAVRLARRNNAIIRDAARALGVGVEDVAAEAERSTAGLKAMQGELRAMTRARARAEAEALIATTGLGKPITLRFSDRDADIALESCKALSERGCIGMAASRPDHTVIVMAPSEEYGLARVLRPISNALGGKGGGGGSFFRSSFADDAALEVFLREAERLLN